VSHRDGASVEDSDIPAFSMEGPTLTAINFNTLYCVNTLSTTSFPV
jgi:hypothetical protein